ncbi:radical SAM protein [Candidatus Omnitrophota bacterium]
MRCDFEKSLYVTSDGVVQCGPHKGGIVPLFSPDINNLDSFSYVRDCYNGKPYIEIRRNFFNNKTVHPCCKGCRYFFADKESAFNDDDYIASEIDVLKIEPSYLCQLSCDACILPQDRTNSKISLRGRGPYLIPVALFRKLIDDLCEAKITVQRIHMFSRGESLLHPQITELVTYAKKSYPQTPIRMHTNGNINFFRGITKIDHLIFSIDGSSQEPYKKYRYGGSIEKAFRLISDTVKYKKYHKLTTPFIEWKYILFDHNDSEEEIVRAQKVADELGVDRFVFCLSPTIQRSKKYTSLELIERDPLFNLRRDKNLFRTCVLLNNVRENEEKSAKTESKRKRREKENALEGRR